MTNPIAEIAAILEAAQVAYAIIGAHAVNTWLEPRFTADLDVAVQAGTAELERLKAAFAERVRRTARLAVAALGDGDDAWCARRWCFGTRRVRWSNGRLG